MADQLTEAQLRAAARAAAAKHGIDPVLFEAQIEQESGYSPAVIYGKRKSSAGAVGIAQFMPRTAKSLGVDPLDPLAALDASAAYMASLTKKFGGDESLGRLAYNWGEGNVAKWQKDPSRKVPKEAQEYNQRIAARAGVAPEAITAGAKPAPTPQQIETAAARTGAPGGRAAQLQAVEDASLEVEAGLPPEPQPVAQAPQQQDPMEWMQTLQSQPPSTPASKLGTDGTGVGTDFVALLTDQAGRAQDDALARMFSDTPQLSQEPDMALPGAVDRYLDKLLT